MSAKNEHYCDTGKKFYAERRDAAQDLASLSRRNKKQVFSTYKCEECGGYHISTVSKKIRLFKRK
jgi:hypothetical protein